MLEELKKSTKVVGNKQTRRAIEEGRVKTVYLARNADPLLQDTIRTLCGERSIPVREVSTMKELGLACSISVGAAVAASLLA